MVLPALDWDALADGLPRVLPAGFRSELALRETGRSNAQRRGFGRFHLRKVTPLPVWVVWYSNEPGPDRVDWSSVEPDTPIFVPQDLYADYNSASSAAYRQARRRGLRATFRAVQDGWEVTFYED